MRLIKMMMVMDSFMKKGIKTTAALIFSTLLLSCSVPLSGNNTDPALLKKIDSVRVSRANFLKIGEGGASVTLNLDLRSPRGFRVKSQLADVSLVEIRMNNVNPSTLAIADVWNDSGTRVISHEIATPGANNTITFNGLRVSETYAISARAYEVYQPSETLSGSSGTTSLTSSADPSDIMIGDTITLDPAGVAEVQEVTNVVGNTITVATNLTNNFSSNNVEIKRNITSIGDIGDLDGSPDGGGMGDADQAGGGTAPALNNEYVSIDGAGLLTIVNDNANNTWDLSLQLKTGGGEQVDGSVNISPGADASGTEDVVISP